MAPRQHNYWLPLFYLVGGLASASAQTGSLNPSAETIVVRMAQARAESRVRLRPYTVTRDYKFFGSDPGNARSEVIANIAFVPPDSKQYSIQKTNGNGIGQILVRRMLASEVEVEKARVSTDLSVDNYDFRFIRKEDASGERNYVLELIPRRKDQFLVRGDVWVDADTYLPRRFEGELAKGPSWWVRNVRITLAYSDVGGMWLQTSTDAAADVRILGRSTMVSRDVKYKITEFLATASSDSTNVLELLPGQPFHYGVIP